MHFDSLIFILLIAVALLFRWLASKAGQASKDSQEPEPRSTPTLGTPPPLPRTEVETDEERIRKFLEALGQPTTSKPPPPVTPRTDIPPRPVAPVRPPPGMLPFPLAGHLTPEDERKRAVILHEAAGAEWPPPPTRKVLSAELVPAAMAQPTAPRPTKVVIEEPPGFPIHQVTVLPPRFPPTAEEPIALPPLTSYEAQSFAPALDRPLSALLVSPEGLRHAIILREIFGPPRSLQPLELVGSA